MTKLKLNLKDGTEISCNSGDLIYKIIDENKLQGKYPVVLCRINGEIHELNSQLKECGNFELIDTSSEIGAKVYTRTAQFVLIKAVADLFPDAKVIIEHSINKAIFGEIFKNRALNIDDIPAIKKRMLHIIEEDITIEKHVMKKSEAIEIFKSFGLQDKVQLLKYTEADFVTLYKLGDTYDYFYGPMAHSTGILTLFELNFYNDGFLLRVPEASLPTEVTNFIDYKKLSNIFYETERWNNILGIGNVGALNEAVDNGGIEELISIAEGLHEKKIANISDLIRFKEKIKVVLISGPSSSGKTTFAKRLSIQLKVNGLRPVSISLDDYFVDREHTPKDENGEYNFESIYALDLRLFNENLQMLIDGKEASLPIFDFVLGKRSGYREPIKLPENGIIVVEGIHGLNEALTSTIKKEYKFKIYVSALTQLNLDDHNRISTTEVRMIRRIVRDFRTRGYDAESTIKMWPSIRRGEETNIFVFQEEADVMFNSTLVHELCILKPFAIEDLEKINKDSSVFVEARNLVNFLKHFKSIDKSKLPKNSLLREFVGDD